MAFRVYWFPLLLNLNIKIYFFLVILMLFFKNRVKDWCVHQLKTQDDISHSSGFYILLDKISEYVWCGLEVSSGGGWRRERLHREAGMVFHAQRTYSWGLARSIPFYKAICFQRIIVTTCLWCTCFPYLAQSVQETAPCHLLCLIFSPGRERERE